MTTITRHKERGDRLILVDTSVLIDLFKGRSNSKVELLESAILQNLPFGISSYTYQEVLQGSRDEVEYQKVKDYLSSQVLYFLPEVIDTYEKAAYMYYQLRRQGVTPRSTIDILIMLTAIENNLYLLHNDKDFDIIAEKVSELRVLNHL